MSPAISNALARQPSLSVAVQDLEMRSNTFRSSAVIGMSPAIH